MKIYFLKYFLICTFFIKVSAYAQQTRKVEILHANSLEYDKSIGENVNRLLGKVVFRHEDFYMFCDSAYFYFDTNTIKAFNNIRIKQGDSILLIGKYLEYNGDTRIAKMRDSVIFMHNKSFLITDSLDYDRNLDMAYYYFKGRIYDGENKLRSKRGYYYTRFRDYYAVDSVVLINPQYTMFSDTLRYNTETAISYFYGPTNIVADSNFIYCENGFYNTRTDEAGFSENAWLRSGSNFLKGDSLFYNRRIRFGEAFKNVSIIDTVENINAYGDYGYFYENPQKAMLTEKALIEYYFDDDVVYLHSDTVFIYVDTADFRHIKAFYKVQAYKTDFQLACDSLYFNSQDSILKLFFNPVVWGKNSQLTGDFIQVHFKDKKADWFFVDGNSFAVMQVEQDTAKFNQVLSRTMLGTINDNKIETIDLKNDCQTIYYVIDEDTDEITAYNKIVSSNMKVAFEDNKLKMIWFYENPKGETIPIEQLKNEQLFLRGFRWLEEFRPKTKDDIFIWKFN